MRLVGPDAVAIDLVELGSFTVASLSYPSESSWTRSNVNTQSCADTHRMIEAHGFEVDDTVPPLA